MNLTAKRTLNTTIYVESLDASNLCGENSLKYLPWKYWFETWLESLKETLPVANGYEVSLRLTSDREIQVLNSQYRQKNQPTDVLAFAALEVSIPIPIEFDEPVYLGDIIISLDTAMKQALTHHHSLESELAWLASHGLLHLIGWDHPDEASLTKMLKKQQDLLKLVSYDRQRTLQVYN